MGRGTLLGLLVWLLLPAGQGLTLRCVSGLVDVGASKAEVLERCGLPSATSLVAVETVTQGGADRAAASELPIERWTYNFGERTFLQILTFRGETLVQIESGDRVSAPTGSGGRLQAAIGDTLAEVREKNGEPFFEEYLGSEAATLSVVERGGRSAVRTLEVPVERWTYRFGPGRFVQVLTFRGGRLEKIESGMRE